MTDERKDKDERGKPAPEPQYAPPGGPAPPTPPTPPKT
jgi:hypothetical protein